MIEMIRDNPNITINQFSTKLDLSEPAIKINLKQLKESGHIQRIKAIIYSYEAYLS
ncbi:MAG: winged helix-turn-helix transcriptional regulator [Bacilli bacterium]|nr:winged helix-turn-helix transcriptional regulator [Bacilli bacterium]